MNCRHSANASNYFRTTDPGLFSFHERDHGDGVPGGLRTWVESQLFQSGIELTGGTIRLMCMPRILGHAFNPISVYFCHGGSGDLLAMLYEVRNTFGGKHTYVMPVAAGATHVHQACAKNFHVSPFLPMQLTYRFRTRTPGDTMSLGITASDAGGIVIATGFGASRQARHRPGAATPISAHAGAGREGAGGHSFRGSSAMAPRPQALSSAEARMFFSGKKEPTNFRESELALSGKAAAKTSKRFLLLFFKKEDRPFLAHRQMNISRVFLSSLLRRMVLGSLAVHTPAARQDRPCGMPPWAACRAHPAPLARHAPAAARRSDRFCRILHRWRLEQPRTSRHSSSSQP